MFNVVITQPSMKDFRSWIALHTVEDEDGNIISDPRTTKKHYLLNDPRNINHIFEIVEKYTVAPYKDESVTYTKSFKKDTESLGKKAKKPFILTESRLMNDLSLETVVHRRFETVKEAKIYAESLLGFKFTKSTK